MIDPGTVSRGKDGLSLSALGRPSRNESMAFYAVDSKEGLEALWLWKVSSFKPIRHDPGRQANESSMDTKTFGNNC
jgi:hypothetical protein